MYTIDDCTIPILISLRPRLPRYVIALKTMPVTSGSVITYLMGSTFCILVVRMPIAENLNLKAYCS